MSMSGQSVLITGASRGIGLAAALELAKDGFSVAVNAPPNDGAPDSTLGDTIARIEALDVPVAEACFDVADISAHEAMLDEIEERLGPLTTLVNNAGVGVMQRGDPLEVSEESFDRCMAVNAKAVFFLSQAFASRILARRRESHLFYSIVNVTSSNAVAVAEPRAEYCASKAAAAMISRAFAVRLGRENIHVYDVQPGLIDTSMTASVIETYKQRAEEGLTLLPRIGTPEEIGKIIALLASGRLPYTTGQVISADAGMLISRF